MRSVFPSTFVSQTACFPSGAKRALLLSQGSFVSQAIFRDAMTNCPMLNEPFAAFEVSRMDFPSGDQSVAWKSLSPSCGVTFVLRPLATSARNTSELWPPESPRVYASCFPSGDQIGSELSSPAGVPCVIAEILRVRRFITWMSYGAAFFGFDRKASVCESGDHRASISETSGVLVRLMTVPFLGDTRKMSHCSLPP